MILALMIILDMFIIVYRIYIYFFIYFLYKLFYSYIIYELLPKKHRPAFDLSKELLQREQGRHHQTYQELLFKEQRIIKTETER